MLIAMLFPPFDAVLLYAQRPRRNSSDVSSATGVMEPILASVREKTLRRVQTISRLVIPYSARLEPDI